ncbi:MAG: hydroxymethylbilane synthase [Nitrospirota bacterium]
MKKERDLIIGTRGSRLAIWQAEWVRAEIKRHFPDMQVSLKKIKTTGDRITDAPLAKIGGKGLFVKEIEESMLRCEIDIAVHSMKDLPVDIPEELHISAITPREDPRDILISRCGLKLSSLSEGAKIGTSSLRRSSQLKYYRNDLNIHPLRGNLDTRIKKLISEGLDAIVLASAGVKRLGFKDQITEYIPFEISLPAIGQGALGIETRISDEDVNQIVKILEDRETAICVTGERGFLQRLEGGCQVPIACYGKMKDGKLHLEGMVAGIDGSELIRDGIKGNPDKAIEMGIILAESILSKGGDRILREVYG